MADKEKATAAGVVGGAVGLGAGLALGSRKKVSAESDSLADVLKDTSEIKIALQDLSNVLRGLLSPQAPSGESGVPPYNVRKFELDTARTKSDPLEVDLPGDALTFYTNGNYEGIEFALDSPTNDWVPVGEFGNPYYYPAKFKKFYLSWTAQSGKYLRVHIGREAGASAAVEITAAAPKQVFYTISSDKDSHFTGSLTTGNKEDENITGLLGNKIRITNIVIEADQALDFWLMFWRKDTFENTDLDEDTFIGMVELDLSTYGNQVGGSGQYYMSLESVDLDYVDEDETNELHISLYNADATAKNSGATGEVVVFIKYELRA